jgi:transcriptional regulator MraZ
MLRGNCQATVDSKGRLKIPADFLAALAEYGNEFYVTSENGNVAQIYPMKQWAEIEERLARRSSHNQTRQKFLDLTGYYGQVVKMDSQGRLLIPPVLRDAAQMQGEVDVMGKLTYLEVWNHSRFLERLRTSQLTPEDDKNLDEMGI